MRALLDRIMDSAPRGPMDVLAVLVLVAFFACVVALTVRMVRNARNG